MKTYYGLTAGMNLEEMCKEVCNCLGYGSNKVAHLLLLETAGTETGRGTVKDPTLFAGMGLTQFDKIPFYDIKERTTSTNKQKIKEYFDIDLDLVEWEHIRNNPVLALIFTRLKYIKVPEAIPPDLLGRAKYWKKYYNTIAGKGTPEHYILANKAFDNE